MGDNGNRLHQFLGLDLPLSRDAATSAWLAMQAKGKIKGKDLQAASRIREAILEDQVVDEKTGSVTWQDAVVKFRHEGDFEVFVKAVNKLVDEDGVDFGLSTGALELQSKAEALQDEIKAAAKAAMKAKETPATA